MIYPRLHGIIFNSYIFVELSKNQMDRNTNPLDRKQASESHTDLCDCNRYSQKPLILAVETSGRMGSVAIALAERILAESAFSAPLRHSAEIFPAICTLLARYGRKPAQIEHIYISIGPGSFTGLRIAATLAKTMNLAVATKIVAVDTLDAIAANVTDYLKTAPGRKTPINHIAAILDAKRGQFFIAAYRLSDSRLEKILPDCLMTASQFLERFAGRPEPVWLLGEGLLYYKDKFKADGICLLDEAYWNPTAAKVHSLGWKLALQGRFAEPLTLTPTYLRRPDVRPKN